MDEHGDVTPCEPSDLPPFQFVAYLKICFVTSVDRGNGLRPAVALPFRFPTVLSLSAEYFLAPPPLSFVFSSSVLLGIGHCWACLRIF